MIALSGAGLYGLWSSLGPLDDFLRLIAQLVCLYCGIIVLGQLEMLLADAWRWLVATGSREKDIGLIASVASFETETEAT